MDFGALVDRARALHEAGTPVSRDIEDVQLSQEVYGRICSSKDSNPPETLALSPSRQTVFVFGPDSITSIILRQNAYDALRSLGFDHDYIYNDVCKLYWCRYSPSPPLTTHTHTHSLSSIGSGTKANFLAGAVHTVSIQTSQQS